MSVTKFTSDISPSIPLTKQVDLELWQIAGNDDVIIEEFCKQFISTDHYGVLYFNFKNFPMAKSYPLLWKIQLSHTADELEYIDGYKLIEIIARKLEEYLTRNLIDQVTMTEIRVLSSDLLMNYPRHEIINAINTGPGEMPFHHPHVTTDVVDSGSMLSAAAVARSEMYPEDANKLTLDDGTVIRYSHPMQRVTMEEAIGFFTMLVRVTPNGIGKEVDTPYIIEGIRDPTVGLSKIMVIFEAFQTEVAVKFLPGTELIGIAVKNADQTFTRLAVTDLYGP